MNAGTRSLVAVSLLMASGAAAAGILGPYHPHFFDMDPSLDACDLYLAPHDHGASDGHAHSHEADPSDGADAPCDQSGMRQSPFAAPTGEIPRPTQASTMKAVNRLVITENEHGDPVAVVNNGNVIGSFTIELPGNGSVGEPYVVEDFLVLNALELRDTNACYVIRENLIAAHAAVRDDGFTASVGQALERIISAGTKSADAGTVVELLRPVTQDRPLTKAPVPSEPGTQPPNPGPGLGIVRDLADGGGIAAGGQPAQLRLNWNGPCVHVHDNRISDLRVNQNIARTGYATGGVIEENHFDFVGQLRHYDGLFQDNEVGPVAADLAVRFAPAFNDQGVVEDAPDGRVLNVDGFNEAVIRGNTIHGSVELDFHGHHHGTGFFAPRSHYHGDVLGLHPDENHHQRWTSVAFVENHVVDPLGYGVRYEDQAHDGDDRSANSETAHVLTSAGLVSHLNHQHRHLSFIQLSRNQIQGGLHVDVLNAPGTQIFTDANGTRVQRDQATGEITNQVHDGEGDPYAVTTTHPWRNDAWLDIEENRVNVNPRSPIGVSARAWDLNFGIRIAAVQDARIRVASNEIEFTGAALPGQGVALPLRLPDHVSADEAAGLANCAGPGIVSLGIPTSMDADPTEKVDVGSVDPESSRCLNHAKAFWRENTRPSPVEFTDYYGIDLDRAQGSNVTIELNTIKGYVDCAIRTHEVTDSTLTLAGNRINGAYYARCNR